MADDAQTTLEGEDLTATFAPQDPDDPSSCTVDDQDPAADDEVDRGTDVTLTISCEVPDVTDESTDDAQSDIESAGMTIAFAPDDPPDGATCTAQDQDPAGNDDADPGSEVTVTITCDVPDVTGEDGETATQDLEDAGFSWSVDACEDQLSTCTVDNQDPEGEADPGAEISLTMAYPE